MIPDGTVLFTYEGNDLVSNVVKLKYAHVLIRLDDAWYHATYPRVTRTSDYKAHTEVLYLKPQVGLRFPDMLRVANENLGRQCSVEGFVNPDKYNQTKGIYSSQYVAMILVAGGARVTIEAGRDPDRLFYALTGKRP